MHDNTFKTFWMAGFECTDQLNAFGRRVDFLETTGHLQMIDEDYKMLDQFNIATVREGIRWSKVEIRPYHYDWSSVAHMIEEGKNHGIQQVWDICHFGFPDDLTPLHPMFARRFAALCRAFVNFFRSIDATGDLVVIPINEVSFLSWLGGDARGTSPYCVGMGWEVKYMLMKAFIEGVAAIKEIDPRIKILTSEPLINVVPPANATDSEVIDAAIVNNFQYQAVDILCGRMCPELGGRPEYLDFVGLNFYYNNQYTINNTEMLSWLNHENDPRWDSLSQLLKIWYKRFNRPVLITETGHPGEHRPLWIQYIGEQCEIVLKQNIPLLGVCIYPIIDRPDWDHLSPWHKSGLWDADFSDSEIPSRVLYQPYADALSDAQDSVAPLLTKSPRKKKPSIQAT